MRSSSTFRRRRSTSTWCCIRSDKAKPQRPGNLVGPLRKLAEHFGRRGIVVVISDFYAEPEEIFDAVGPIVHRGNDVVLFHVLDPQEIDFSFTEASSFEDMESGDQMPIVPTKLAADYRALVKAHIDTLTSKAGAQPVDYMLLNTAMPLDFALFRFLSMRQRLVENEVSRVVSHAAVPARARRPRGAGADSPDAARAQVGGRISVADVPAQDSVRIGAAAAHPRLAAAGDAARRRSR